MRIYDEENLPYDESEDEMSGYSVIEDNSIFKILAPEPEPETIATPIPENEQTVILSDPHVAGLSDGKELRLDFDGDGCAVFFGEKKIGGLKPAYVAKLKAERGGQSARVYYKETVPPMVRIVFGDGEIIPTQE